MKLAGGIFNQQLCEGSPLAVRERPPHRLGYLLVVGQKQGWESSLAIDKNLPWLKRVVVSGGRCQSGWRQSCGVLSCLPVTVKRSPRIWRGRLLWQLVGLLLDCRHGQAVEWDACGGFHHEGWGIELRWIDRRIAGDVSNRSRIGDRAAPATVAH